jgi:hypothetical protein
VFAYRVPADGNILSTRTCAPGSSLRRSDTSEERAFLQSLSLPSSGGRGFGGVYDETTFVPGQRRQPSVEARLTLTGEGINRTETSIKGTFSFNDLEPRAYVLSIDVPSGFEAWAPATVTVPDPHACVDRSYVLHRTGG